MLSFLTCKHCMDEDLIFGVKMVAETGYPGGIDNGPANVGMGLNRSWRGLGSMFELYGLDFGGLLKDMLTMLQ